MKMTLVTIVAEAILEDRLVRDLHAVGATGHTITTVHGAGSRGVRVGASGDGNVRIETLVGSEVAEALLGVLADRYFPHYAAIAWTAEVTVLRGHKFG